MKVQKENRNIKVPQELYLQKSFALKISENNQKLFKHIQCLRSLVQKIHDTYAKMSKSILKISQQFQKKMLNYKDGTGMCIINFIRGINTIHLNISNQVNNNTVALNTKTYKITKTRKEIIHEKLIKINQLVNVFLQLVAQFNQKDQRYVQKSLYFQDFQEDNNALYNKLLGKERVLQQILEKTYTTKVQLKSGLVQLRVSLKQFFQMIKANVQEYKKLLITIRKKINITKFFNQSVIQEVSSQAQESIRNEEIQKYKISHLKQQQQKSIVQDRKSVIKSFQDQLEAQQILYDFIEYLKKQIQNAGLNIDSIREDSSYIQIDDRKLQMADILSQDLVANIKMIKDQIANFRQIILRLTNHFQQIKILEQLKKYRKHKFETFLHDTQPLCDLSKKNPKSLAIQSEYKLLKNRFEQIHRLHMCKFRQIVIKLFQKISEQYKTKGISQIIHNKNVMEVFNKKPLSITMISFFSNKQQSPPKFQSCSQMKKYGRLQITNQNQKISLDIMSDVSMEMGKTKQKKSMGCCGLLCFGGQKKESKIIQKYNCALKKGILLIQGKLKLHQSYIGFISIFNPKNIFFNTCDIRIPKWDIIQIKRGTYLLSILITIVTTHGQIQFTSFLNDPLSQLEELYSNRNPYLLPIQQSKKACQKYKKTQTTSNVIKQIQILQQKFQSELPRLINKQFRIQSLSTYLSQDKKKLLISVQYHNINQSKKYFFQIKIVEVGSGIKYQFVHQNSVKNIKIKQHLQKIAIDIINGKTQNVYKSIGCKQQNLQKDQKISQILSIDSCSFIQKKQNNQFSFQEQPNFLYQMQQNNQVHEGQPSFNYTPDLQIFKKFDEDKTKKMKNSKISSQNRLSQNKLNQSEKENSLQQINKTVKLHQKTLQKLQQNYKQKQKIMDSVNTESVLTQKNDSKKLSKKTSINKSSECRTKQSGNINFVLYLIGGAILLNMILSIFK